MLVWVSVKDNLRSSWCSRSIPTRRHIAAHLVTPHFKRFREETNDIVKSRRLIDTVPIILGAKAK